MRELVPIYELAFSECLLSMGETVLIIICA